MSRKTQRRATISPRLRPAVEVLPVADPIQDAPDPSGGGDSVDPEELENFLAMPPLVTTPFAVDPVQQEARDAVRTGDTIFVASTGYGKSWVAYEAAGDTIGAGGQVYYTTPLKALSNQKFADLTERFGAGRVGIVTGDRRENPNAPIVVLTTEILRAMLLAGDVPATPDASPLIVLDECHWLADPERGPTWEEVILLAPRLARLLLLSASIGNGDQLAAWLEEARGASPTFLQVAVRAVPQRWGVWHDGRVLPLADAIARKRASGISPVWPRLVELLKRSGLTPALAFVPTRRQCEALTDQCVSVEGLSIRAHHAGMTLTDRLILERQLQAGEIDVIFCTTTLASGIDAPVKTVVIGSFNDGRGLPMSPTLIQQMAGRAGRRGRDALGFVIAVAANVRELDRIMDTLRLPPEKIESAFITTYQAMLRLVADKGRAGALSFASRSFASFQRREWIWESREQVDHARTELDDFLKKLVPRSCADPAVTWPKFLTAGDALSPLDLAGHWDRLRDGYLCARGIAFARDQKRVKKTVILSPEGTLAEIPFSLPPITNDPNLVREAHQALRTLLDTLAPGPELQQWYVFGSPGGARSLAKVHAIAGDRVSFGGEGTYPRSRLIDKKAHALDPRPYGPLIADLLARASALGPASVGSADLAIVPCLRCPALNRCPDQISEIQARTNRLREYEVELEALDPATRSARLIDVLVRLGALGPDDRPTELGRALLVTYDRAALFFALARARLAELSPERLALVVAATRDVRMGFGPAPVDLLPDWYPNEVNRAVGIEIEAYGNATLETFARDIVREASVGRPVSGDPPSVADRRAHVFQRLWAGVPIDAVGIPPGDAERLFSDTVATLNNLRVLPEVRETAGAAVDHLRTVAVGQELLRAQRPDDPIDDHGGLALAGR